MKIEARVKQRWIGILTGLLSKQMTYDQFDDAFGDAFFEIIDNGGRPLVCWEKRLAAVHLRLHEVGDGFADKEDVYHEVYSALDCFGVEDKCWPVFEAER